MGIINWVRFVLKWNWNGIFYEIIIMSNKEKKKDIDDFKLCNVKFFTNCMIDVFLK